MLFRSEVDFLLAFSLQIRIKASQTVPVLRIYVEYFIEVLQLLHGGEKKHCTFRLYMHCFYSDDVWALRPFSRLTNDLNCCCGALLWLVNHSYRYDSCLGSNQAKHIPQVLTCVNLFM